MIHKAERLSNSIWGARFTTIALAGLSDCVYGSWDRNGRSLKAQALFLLQTVLELMSASSSVNITELIDRCPPGRLRIRIVVPFRFFTGIGLGGAMPSFISLAAEYIPRSNRQAVVGLLWTGFPLGEVLTNPANGIRPFHLWDGHSNMFASHVVSSEGTTTPICKRTPGMITALAALLTENPQPGNQNRSATLIIEATV